MISYKEALNIILRAGKQNVFPHEIIGIEDIAGRICAADIAAPIANQPFDNSAMDGFALRTEDLALASNDNPVTLDMAGHIAAGDSTLYAAPAPGQCYQIMTGAPLPPGCDAIVPVEKTEKGLKSGILFRDKAEKGENIRYAGEDFRAGDIILFKGTILNSGHVLALATLGIGRIKVLARPRIALISTGREIVDELGAELNAGHIYNSTRPYLVSALKSRGAEIESCGTVPDDPELFKRKLAGMSGGNVDICISTGAVSAGVHDFIPSVLKEMGAEILFHKVAIRPGKPILFARLSSGAFFFGLPGNPVSSAVGFRFFVRPLIDLLQGLAAEEPSYATLRNSWQGRGGKDLCFFVRTKASIDDKALYEAEIPQGQQSFKVRPFVDTNSWGIIPEGTSSLHAGNLIALYKD